MADKDEDKGAQGPGEPTVDEPTAPALDDDNEKTEWEEAGEDVPHASQVADASSAADKTDDDDVQQPVEGSTG